MDEKGQVCLPIISAENWKPATKTDQGKILLNLLIYKRKEICIIDLLYL